MTVAEMLARISSYELTEWAAYEQMTGPLGPSWRDDVLAAIHEQLQVGNRVAGGQAKKNPCPEPKAVTRPHELMKEAKRRGNRN